jgi:tRNA/tmRNA/rRNA uracil-C5-methylase (TrmA/RlmC/RlmD family)
VETVDAILLDPPRSGAGELVVMQMIEKKPRVIVYVSCDPASLARDSKLLNDKGYKLDDIVGIDLFPMTHHVECVAKFSLIK